MGHFHLGSLRDIFPNDVTGKPRTCNIVACGGTHQTPPQSVCRPIVVSETRSGGPHIFPQIRIRTTAKQWGTQARIRVLGNHGVVLGVQPPSPKFVITLYLVWGCISSLLAPIFILGAMGAQPPAAPRTPKIGHYPISCLGAHRFAIGLFFYFGGGRGRHNAPPP